MLSWQMPPRLAIVVPCYNEEDVLMQTAFKLSEQLHLLMDAGRISPDSYILFVDDGSVDRTWNIIENMHRSMDVVKGLKLSGNVGHQNALMSGLMKVRETCDCAISMDADLQDDVKVLKLMIDRFLEGHDIVYGVRNNRDCDSWFKRATARSFYRFMRKMEVNLVEDHADFRLLSRRALAALSEYKEYNLFLRGIIPSLGFPSATVHYERNQRAAGISKYPLQKMIALALQGITSFTSKPLRYVGMLGALGIAVTLVFALFAIVGHLTGHTVSGWSSLAVSISFFSSVQLVSISLLGEYIAKMYLEVKNRPRWIVDKELVE